MCNAPTDNLIKCMELAVKRKDFSETLAFIKTVHTTNINALVPETSRDGATKRLEAVLEVAPFLNLWKTVQFSDASECMYIGQPPTKRPPSGDGADRVPSFFLYQ